MYELGHMLRPWPLPQTLNSATHWTVTLPIPPRQQCIHIHLLPSSSIFLVSPKMSQAHCLFLDASVTGLGSPTPVAFDHGMLRFLVFWAHILTIWELLLSTCGSLTRMHNCLFSWVSPAKSQFQLLPSTEASPNHLLQLHIATCNQIYWIFLLIQRYKGRVDFDYVQTSPSCGSWR